MNRSDIVKSYVPAFFRDTEPLKSIYEASGYETGKLMDDIEDILNQMYVANATWGLDAWERFVGIKKVPTQTYEQRRENIISQLRGVGTTTKEMLKNLAVSFSGGEVDIIEDAPNYTFIVKFIGVKGVPSNMTGLIAAIERSRPAHLSFSFEYTFMTWNQHDSYGHTWDQWDGLNLTWDMFEVYDD